MQSCLVYPEWLHIVVVITICSWMYTNESRRLKLSLAAHGCTGGNGQHFYWGFFTLVPFNPKPIKPLQIKVKSWMRTKMQWYHCKLVKWVERINVNLWNLQIRWKHSYFHCNWKLNNCKDDCFIQQSVIPIVKVFLLNCFPPSEVGLKPHLPLLLFRQCWWVAGPLLSHFPPRCTSFPPDKYYSLV